MILCQDVCGYRVTLTSVDIEYTRRRLPSPSDRPPALCAPPSPSIMPRRRRMPHVMKSLFAQFRAMRNSEPFAACGQGKTAGQVALKGARWPHASTRECSQKRRPAGPTPKRKLYSGLAQIVGQL
jgi:hypothetical protein